MLSLGSGVIKVAPWVAACSPAAISTTYPTFTAIGESGGDIEWDVDFSMKEFFGQSAFAVARGYYQGKITIKAKKVELYPANLSEFLNAVHTTSGTPTADVYSLTATTLPVPLALQFVHTRSDVPNKFVTVYLFKAFTPQLNFPFHREDIGQQDWTFEAIADRTMTNSDVARVEATQ